MSSRRLSIPCQAQIQLGQSGYIGHRKASTALVAGTQSTMWLSRRCHHSDLAVLPAARDRFKEHRHCHPTTDKSLMLRVQAPRAANLAQWDHRCSPRQP